VMIRNKGFPPEESLKIGGIIKILGQKTVPPRQKMTPQTKKLSGQKTKNQIPSDIKGLN